MLKVPCVKCGKKRWVRAGAEPACRRCLTGKNHVRRAKHEKHAKKKREPQPENVKKKRDGR